MWATIRAIAGSAMAGRCRWCRKAVVWVIDEHGKYHPFNLGFTIRELVTHPKTHLRLLVLSKDDKHDCPAWRKQLANKRSQKRHNR